MRLRRRLGILFVMALAAALLPAVARAQAPTNDDIATPEVIEGTSGNVSVDGWDATFDPDTDPMFHVGWCDPWTPDWCMPDDFWGYSLWYEWTGPYQVGPTTFVLNGNDDEQALGVYTVDEWGTLTEVAYNFRAPLLSDENIARVDFIPTEGQPYLIGVATTDADLMWSPTPDRPANDDLGAVALAGDAIGSTVDATHESGEPAELGGRSVWYTYSPAEDTIVNLDTNGSNYDTRLGVYTGTLGSLTQIAVNDDGGLGSQSALDFQAVAGTTYYIGIGGWDSYYEHGGQAMQWGDSGEYSLHVRFGTFLPSAPDWLSASVGDSHLDITWGAGPDGGSDITSYTLAYREKSAAGWSELTPDPPTATAITIGSLTNGVTYEIRLRATNAIGTGDWSAIEEATPYTLPDKPDLPTATASVGQSVGSVELTWTAPYNGGSNIYQYVIAYKEASASSWTELWVTSTTRIIGSLTNGVTYEFKVMAQNRAGFSPYSDVATAMPYNTGVSITSAVTAKGIVTVTFAGTGAPLPTIYECSRDNVTWATCAPPTWQIKAKGAKTVYVRAKVTPAGPWFTASKSTRG